MSKVFSPSEMGSSLQEKNLLPAGANSFLVEQTPFQEGSVSKKVNRKS